MTNTAAMTNDLVSTREALQMLGYANPSTISRLVESNKLRPAMRVGGGRGAFLFHRSDVEALRDGAVAS